MNLFETVVHHTVKDLDDPNYIENNAPFPTDDVKGSYLGYGYYFWDNHIELAHNWGLIHYQNKYVICEGQLEVEENLFLDLVGSRDDQIYISNCIAEMPKLNGLSIGEIIEFLKDFDKLPNNKGFFPFKVIRAIDTSTTSYKQPIVNFAKNKLGKTVLNPKMIICLVEKNKVFLSPLKIVYPDKYI